MAAELVMLSLLSVGAGCAVGYVLAWLCGLE